MLPARDHALATLLIGALLTISSSAPIMFTYSIVAGPFGGDSTICTDQDLVNCGQTVSSIPAPGKPAHVWVKPGRVQGNYIVSVTPVSQPMPKTATECYAFFVGNVTLKILRAKACPDKTPIAILKPYPLSPQ